MRTVKESTSHVDRTNKDVAEWLGRVEDGARPPPTLQPFEFDETDGGLADDADEDDDDSGSTGTARESPLDDAFPVRQIEKLHISSHGEREKEKRGEGSAAEALAEDAAAVKHDVVCVSAFEIFSVELNKFTTGSDQQGLLQAWADDGCEPEDPTRPGPFQVQLDHTRSRHQ